ncbi:co-chaperone protein daf-41 [Ditylenchus destructor]|uniref:Co-chaperone protein daf-41 n=1 Tax=Ditylenchus destructor TaxID=166010 RepID=A0AAD4RD96_9BILA|nr:co-chaperone protein daf-41 [Ditylenchus destructor]
MTVKHPTTLWAQRTDHIYLSIEVEDMKISEMTVNEDSFKIKGTKGDDVYEADLQLYGKLKGNDRRQIATDRRVELVIPKVTAEWWPRLLKEKTKMPWVKVDFDKWKDEDEENEDAGGFDGMDFSNFAMPGGDKGFNMNDLSMGDDAEDDEDMGELEDIDEPEGTKTGQSEGSSEGDAKKDEGENKNTKEGDEAAAAKS